MIPLFPPTLFALEWRLAADDHQQLLSPTRSFHEGDTFAWLCYRDTPSGN
jgi:hypothetical protein